MKWINISIMILLLGCSVSPTRSSEFWDDACLVTELHPCGKKSLNMRQPLSPEDTRILMCRVDALVKCRIKGNK